MSSVAATTNTTPEAPAAASTPAPDTTQHVPATLAEAKAQVKARRAEAAKAKDAKPDAAPAAGGEPAAPQGTPEAKPDEAAKKPEDERVARAFRQIQQRDKELQNAKKSFDEEKKAHAAKVAEAEALAEQAALFKKDPIEWMKKHGGKDAYDRLTQWRLAGDTQPVDERLTLAEQRAAAAEAKAKEVEERIAKEKAEADEAARMASGRAQLAEYKSTFAPHFTPQERAAAKVFGIADLEQAAVDFAKEEVGKLRESGLDGAELENELTAPRIAVKVKAILEQQLSELRGNEVLQGIFGANGAANTAPSTPKPAPKTGPKQPQAPSLNNAMSATTDVGLGDLSLAERKRLVHRRRAR